MAINVWPADAVASDPSYSGRELRQVQSPALAGTTSARPLGALSGVRPGTPTSTVSATSTLWTVKPHAGVLDVQSSAIAGPYWYAVDADVTGAVTAANATNPRKDILYVQLSDPAEGDGSTTPGVAVAYLAGTAAPTPSVPATPARSIRIATISVPVSGGGSPTVTWDAPYMAGAGGFIPTRTTTERDALLTLGNTECPVLVSVGTTLYAGNGTAWKTIGGDDTGWQTLTLDPSVTTVDGLTPRIRRINGVAHLSGRVDQASSSTIATIPVGFRPDRDQRQVAYLGSSGTTPGVVIYTASTGKIGTAAAAIINLDGVSWPADA